MRRPGPIRVAPHSAPHDPAAWLLWVAALLALGLQVLAITPPLLNVDEAIEGLAARQILEGEFPIFFYGQAHMGTPGVFALALLLGLHVPPALAVKLLALVVYAGFAWGLVGLSTAAFDRATARLVGLLLLLPAPYLFEWSHEGRTHYTLVLALGILLLLVAYRLAVGGGPPRRWLAFGLVGGLGLWTSFLFLFYLGPALAVAAAGAGRRLRAAWLALALLGFALGGAPFWLFNLAYRLASFDFGPARLPPVEPGAAAARFLTETLPALTGPSPLPPGGPGPLGWGTGALAVAALGAGLGAAARSWRQHAPRRWAWTLLLGVALVTGVANLRSAYAQDPVRIAGAPGPLMAEGRAVDPRYALALASMLPIAQARLFLGLRWLGPGARWGLALALVALHGTLDARLALGITGQASAARAADTRDEAARRLLGAHGVEAVYTPRWPSLYAFRWGPALAVAHPYQEIYPPLALRVDAAERVAFLLPANDPQWTWLPASLRAAGLGFGEARTEGWRILWDFQAGPPVAPWRSADWRATATVNPEDAPAAVDGDLATRWATGRGRHEGDALMVSLGRVETVAGVRWLPGSHREVPSGIRAEGSLDGERWSRLQEVRPYLGPVFASDGHPFVRLRRARVELRFPPAAIRHLRLTHLGEGGLPWSIRELVLLVPAAPPPARDPGALVRALRQAGVRRVDADHWPAAAIHTAARGAIAVPISNETVDAYGRLGPRSEAIAPLRLGEGDALVVGAEAGAETREALEASGVAVAVEMAGGFAVIRARGQPRPLGQPASPAGWRVTATHRPAEADRTLDGRPETHWRSGTPQRPGMAVEFDLGRLLRLAGVRLVAARPDETPRALTIRLSPDRTRWVRVEPEWRGALGWTGWSLVRLSQGVYAVAFPPQAARRVRLELTGAATASEWSIAEAEWYVTGAGE